MKAAVIQLNAQQDKAKNVAHAVERVRQAIAAKAKLILLPEVFNYRGPLGEVLNAIAEGIPGESTTPFLELAKKHKVYILAGSVYEKSKNRNKVYNTSVLIDEKGQIAAKYRKINLFEATIGEKTISEKKYFLAGTKESTATVQDFQVGLTICYDLRFPEVYRQYSAGGCHILTAPSSFTKKTGQAHWEVLIRARAIENLCYVLAPNQIGRDWRGVETYGNSLIVSPWGEILARGSGNREEVLYAELHREDIFRAQKVLPQVRG